MYVQGELFKALVKTRLIAPDADISCLQYSRCGRTDKGVSALGQVRRVIETHGSYTGLLGLFKGSTLNPNSFT